MHQPSLYLFSQEEVEVEVEAEEEEEEAEEEVPQLHPLPLHPVPDLLVVEVVEDHPDHPLGHLLVHQSHQLPPQIPQMISWEETRHKSSQEIEKRADDSYSNFNSIEA